MTASAHASPAPAPRRRRRRWPWVLAATLVLLAVAAVVVAEGVARSIVPERVRETVVAQLGLPEDQPLDVTVGGVLVLPQLIAGRLDELRVAGADVPLPGEAAAGLTVDADVRLTGVPLREGVQGGPGTAELRLGADDLQLLLADARLPDTLADSTVTLAEPDAVLTSEVSILGASIPIELSLAPGAADGDLTLEPTGARIGGAQLSLEQLAAMAGIELGPVPVCLADRLPSGLALTAVAVEGDALVADLDVAAGMMTDPALLEPGTCD
ncbi:LmeA family phospholipid-binding protein [Microbacterium lacusdiani]